MSVSVRFVCGQGSYVLALLFNFLCFSVTVVVVVAVDQMSLYFKAGQAHVTHHQNQQAV